MSETFLCYVIFFSMVILLSVSIYSMWTLRIIRREESHSHPWFDDPRYIDAVHNRDWDTCNQIVNEYISKGKF